MDVTDQDPEEWIHDQQRTQFDQFRQQEVVGDHCESCQLSPDPIIKRGSLKAPLMLVGEFPRRKDLENDQPFSEDYGQLIEDMISGIDLDPDEDCYWTNALLCGGGSIDVRQTSIDSCNVNLRRQVKLVSPEVILILGKLAFCSVYGHSVEKNFDDQWGYQGTVPDFPWIDGVVSLNPVHLLETNEGSTRHRKMKKIIWSHLQRVRDLLDEPVDVEDDDSGDRSS